MTIDRLAHPALVIVDMQNDFVRVGAPLEVPESRPTIPAHQALLAVCRERRIPVIYTKFVAGPERTLVWGDEVPVPDRPGELPVRLTRADRLGRGECGPHRPPPPRPVLAQKRARESMRG